MEFDQIKDNLKRKITYYVYGLAITIVALFLMLPQIFDIWDKKAALAEISEEYNQITKKWFTFAELKKEVVLINDEKLKVKCHAYALGWFDEVKLENNFQMCINEHQAKGYKIVEKTNA